MLSDSCDSWGGAMLTIEVSIFIDRPREEVAAYLSDVPNGAVWQNNVVESVKTSDGEVGVGTTGREVRLFLGRPFESEWEITGYDLSGDIWTVSVDIVSGPIKGHGEDTLESLNGGTRFTRSFAAEPKGLMALAGPMFERVARSQGEVDLANLKRILEFGK